MLAEVFCAGGNQAFTGKFMTVPAAILEKIKMIVNRKSFLLGCFLDYRDLQRNPAQILLGHSVFFGYNVKIPRTFRKINSNLFVFGRIPLVYKNKSSKLFQTSVCCYSDQSNGWRKGWPDFSQFSQRIPPEWITHGPIYPNDLLYLHTVFRM